MNVKAFRDLFYRCQFKQIINQLGQNNSSFTPLRESNVEDGLFLASSYYELKQNGNAVESLEETAAILKKTNKESYLYALARLAYLDEDLAKAYELFMKCFRATTDQKIRFRCQLGMANVLFSYKQLHLVEKILTELVEYKNLSTDDQIGLLILKGNFAREHRKDNQEALNFYKDALELASIHGWTYFIHRCLFGMASTYLRENNFQALKATILTLESLLKFSDDLRLIELVQERFVKFTKLTGDVEIDADNKRIKIDEIWLTFHDKPLLYSFFEALYQEESFVNKKNLALRLWPEEDYKPRMHDPRIFDIAKRARGLIKNSTKTKILSGRLGYKLCHAS